MDDALGRRLVQPLGGLVVLRPRLLDRPGLDDLERGALPRQHRRPGPPVLALRRSSTPFDVRPTPGLPPERSVVATLADTDALREAAAGVSAIIHLAATPDDARFPRGAPPDDGDNFLNELVPNNVAGPYHVMEAARTLGMRPILRAADLAAATPGRGRVAIMSVEGADFLEGRLDHVQGAYDRGVRSIQRTNATGNVT